MPTLLTEPIPTAIPGFIFDLSDESDDVQLAAGLLANFPGGVRALGGSDRIEGSLDGEIMSGNVGADTLIGNGGNDSLSGGRDNDRLGGNDGDDFLFGNLGNDVINGGNGNDGLFGGKDNDNLNGANGNDDLYGDIGDDTLTGEAGLDLLSGGEGLDVFQLRYDDRSTVADIVAGVGNADIITDFNAIDDRVRFLGLNSVETSRLVAVAVDKLPISVLQTFPAIARGTIPLSTLDPDGDGLMSGISIEVPETQISFGLVLNVTPQQMASRILA
jgi:Ca2+-binding RTX toxin-like protein